MNITYLIFAHANLPFLEHLINRLEAPNTDFFIHIDKKSKECFTHLLSIRNVYFAKNRFDIKWGDISMVKALLSACEELTNVCKGEMVVFLGGTDYPVKNNQYINDYLESHKNINFIQGYSLPTTSLNWTEGGRRRIECYALRLQERCIATIEPNKLTFNNLRQIIKVLLKNPYKIKQALQIFFTYPSRKHPDYLIPYGGEFWWILPTNSIKRILKYTKEHPDFFSYHKNTSNPDELYFNTLVYNLYNKEELTNDCLRYIKWGGKPSPKNITKEDYKLINKCVKESDTLFVRKIDNIEVCQLIDKLCLLS